MGTYEDKSTDNELFRPRTAPKQQNTEKHTEKVPQLLSKKWLAAYFGFVRPCGVVYYAGLYRHVLTVDVLTRAGLDMETVRTRQVKTFDRTSSLLLIEILGLHS